MPLSWLRRLDAVWRSVVWLVGEVVGYGSIKSASRMNNSVVVFLDSVDKVNRVVESGVVIQDTFTPVFSLVNLAKKVIISNVPPFIRNEVLAKELSRHGELVSPIKLIPLGCKSPHLKHVMSFRRQGFMILNRNEEDLHLTFKFKVDDFDSFAHAQRGQGRPVRLLARSRLGRQSMLRRAGQRLRMRTYKVIQAQRRKLTGGHLIHKPIWKLRQVSNR